MAAQTPPQSALREFCPLYYLLNAIPAKVQKGFRSVVVYLTALDTNSDYIAVGSSIGMLYLYCRRVCQMNKYNIEGKSEAITTVKLLSCFDDLVAVGTASGRVALFQLVSQLPGRNKQLRRFDVVGLHKSTVTALAWSANGMKLFSGDDKGKVVYSAVDLDQGVCNPVLLFEEPSAIVQLEYSQKVLLISSHQRSLLFYTQEQALQQLGTKPRKSNGKFGACFQPGLCKQSGLLVYAARPGLRLWRTDVRGLVEDTRVLKPLFNQQVPQFELFPRPAPTGGYRPQERQLGLVSCFLREGWVLSWNEYSVYVLDCLNQVIIGALESCGDIVSVSCTENEIFILKGDRDIVRISNTPEGLASNISELSLRLTSPLTTPTILLPPTGSVETAQPIRTMAIITEHGERLVDEEVEEVEEVLEQDQLSDNPEAGEAVALVERPEVGERLSHQRGASVGGTSESRSRSSSITSWDSVQGMMLSTPTTTEQSDLSSSRYSAINQEDFQQELVVNWATRHCRLPRVEMGLPALGLIPFLGPLAFPVALGTVAVGGFILIKAIHKKPSYHPGSPIITRSVKVKSNNASGNEPTGNAASKTTEGQQSSNETNIIIAYGLGVVDTYKNVKKGRPSQFGPGNFRMAEADHIPPLASLRIARNHERLDRLLQVNPRLHEMIMSLDYDPTGQNLLTMRVLYQDHRDALTTGNSRESQVSSRLLAETIVDGDAALMLRKAFIMGHPISSWQLREDAGLAAPYTDGNIDMSDEGTRQYYRYGYIELVEAYHKKGIINKNQAEQLIAWVKREMYLDRDTQEYKEILDDIKRHICVFRW